MNLSPFELIDNVKCPPYHALHHTLHTPRKSKLREVVDIFSSNHVKMQRSGHLCSLQRHDVDTVSMEDILNMTRYWSTEDWRNNVEMIGNGDIMFYFYIVKQEEEIR